MFRNPIVVSIVRSLLRLNVKCFSRSCGKGPCGPKKPPKPKSPKRKELPVASVCPCKPCGPPPPCKPCPCPPSPFAPMASCPQPPPNCSFKPICQQGNVPPLPDRIPYNPCCPHYPDLSPGFFKLFTLLVFLPIILIQSCKTLWLGHEVPEKQTCRHFEYMRRRTKRFPWGDGNKTFFHNDRVNSLPEECTNQPQPQDCL